MSNKVYLAGGYLSNWQDKVKREVPNLLFIDPRCKEFDREGKRVTLSTIQYSVWDKHSIKSSNIIFVYAERTNPGFGYALEASYAKGLGKTVILVLEDQNETIKDKYLMFLTSFANIVFSTLEEGIEYLRIFDEYEK